MAVIRNVMVRLSANDSGFSRGFKRAAKDMQKFQKVAGKGLKMTAIVGGVSALGGAAAASAVQVANLAAALAPAAGLLAALPGAAIGAGLAMVTLKVALSGVGDAFGAALTGDTKAFEEALKKLSPAAQSVAKEFRGVVPQLNALKSSVQDSFFTPLKGQIEATANAVSGPLRRSMSALSGEFGLGAKSILEWVRQASTVGSIQSIFSRLQQTVRSVRPAMKPLLDGILAIAHVGARFLAAMGPGFAKLITQFGNWLSAAADSGRAMQWMETGLLVVKQLGAVLGNVLGILKSVFSAATAGGGSLLGTFGQLTASLNTFLKSAEGTKVLQAVFGGISQIGKALSPVLIAIVKGIGAIAPGIGKIAIAVGPVLTAAVNALAPALAALAPGIVALITGLGGAVTALANSGALTLLGQAISAIAVALAPLLPAMGQLVALLVKGLAVFVIRLIESGALGSLVQAVIQLASALGQSLLDALTAVAPYIPDLVVALSDFLVALIPLIPSLMELLIAATPLIPVFTDMITIVSELTTAVLPYWIRVLEIAAKVTNDLANIVRVAWGKISGFIHDKIKFMNDAVNLVVSNSYGLPGKILGAIGNGVSLLYNFGRNVIIGLWNGIVSMANWIRNSITNLVKSIIPGPVRRVLGIASPSKLFKGFGKNLGEGLILGMQGTYGMVAAAAEGLAGAAVPSMAMAGGPSMSTPVGVLRSAGSGVPSAVSEERLAAALGREMDRRGIGAAYLDGELISNNVSRRQGRATEQRRRTG